MQNNKTFEPLNKQQDNMADSIIICFLDCGGDDYCDSCDGICKPTAH